MSEVGQDFDALMRAVGTLNRSLLGVGESIAAAAGQTHARSMCLQQIVGEPRTVANIAARLGTTRQSAQRVADLLVEDGLAAYTENPRHRRAQLLALTADGHAALSAMRSKHQDWVRRAAASLESKHLAELAGQLREIDQIINQLGAR